MQLLTCKSGLFFASIHVDFIHRELLPVYGNHHRWSSNDGQTLHETLVRFAVQFETLLLLETIYPDALPLQSFLLIYLNH